MSVVELRREGDIAVITVNNPPVNAQNNAVRAGLVDAFTKAAADKDAKGIVFTCAGRTFIAGSDISEFGKTIQSPTTPDVIEAIEKAGKPVVAAIFGTPMGGGLELALACHFRIAALNTKPALPEIKLGLIPGYGGTQRLPRLVGESRAMEMILTGRTIDAEEAERIGIVNRLVDGDLIEAGTAFAREMTGYSLPVLNLARDAIRRAPDLPLHEGLKIEADLSTLAFQTADSVEGMTAFVEKRQAIFKDG